MPPLAARRAARLLRDGNLKMSARVDGRLIGVSLSESINSPMTRAESVLAGHWQERHNNRRYQRVRVETLICEIRPEYGDSCHFVPLPTHHWTA